MKNLYWAHLVEVTWVKIPHLYPFMAILYSLQQIDKMALKTHLDCFSNGKQQQAPYLQYVNLPEVR
jgi:hypothetical protein